MRIPRFFSPKVRFLSLATTLALFSATSVEAGTPTLLSTRSDFDSRSLLAPGSSYSPSTFSSFQLVSPGRFSMRQSYSLSAFSGSAGSGSSGLYLNTLMYRLSMPLTVFADVGFYTPIHSTVPGLQQEGGPGSIVFPRLGLEYKPNDRWTVNLELMNGADAWKAYGGMPGSSSFYSGSLSP